MTRTKVREWVPGWLTLIISVLILGATRSIALAIVGQYVGLIYEVKRRPLFLLRGKPVDRITLDEQESQ